MAIVNQKAAGKHPQADNRRPDYFPDIHDRVWFGTCDMKTGDPAESPKPSGWSAPLSPRYLKGLFLPPEQYRKIRREIGKPPVMDIDYDLWVADWTNAKATWDRGLTDITRAMTNGFDALRQLEDPSPKIYDLIGPSPFPPMEVIERMMDGDDWALGKTDVVPLWFTPKLHNEIVRAAKQNRMLQNWQLKELALLERKGVIEAVGAPAPVAPKAPPKRHRSKAVLTAMDKDEVVEIAESYQLVTAEQTKTALILAILDAQPKKAKPSP